jgi:zinc/manganese transport system permease protein
MSLLALMGLPFLACLLMAGILGYLGLHVLKREVIFIDIALAQVAALGAIAVHLSFHVHGDSALAAAAAVGANLVVAMFFALVRRHVSQLPIEATIGITYAIVAAGTLFLIGKSSGGHTHVQEMLTGSLLWVTWRDVQWSGLAFACAGFCFFLFRHPLQRVSDHYERAAQDGMRVVWWDFLFYGLCGIVITFGVRLAGVVVVFCFLIIPATVSWLLAERWGARLVIAWLAGIAASVMGLLFCHRIDFSAGVSVALFLVLIVGAVAISTKLWGSRGTPTVK